MSERIIEAGSGGLFAYLGRVWQYRRLALTFARRDLKTQYAQTLLGLLWSVIQPLTGLLVFTLFFDLLIGLRPEQLDHAPYPLFAFSGMISWYYFTFLIAHAGTSVTNSQDLIRKVYFPKLLLPCSKVLVGAVEFGISLVLLIGMMLILGHPFSLNILFLPLAMLLNVVVGLSLGIWLAALTVRFRDFHHIIPYLVNFGIWLTPVFYPGTLFPEKYHFLLYLNPMAGVIALFRWSLLGAPLPSPWFGLSIGAAFLLLLLGILFFRKVEKTIADLV
ncbi:MAG: ABC transporter permease [Bacteroidia bacterium]|nr:ABC transporter permease [Bacteroidia bacterium]